MFSHLCLQGHQFPLKTIYLFFLHKSRACIENRIFCWSLTELFTVIGWVIHKVCFVFCEKLRCLGTYCVPYRATRLQCKAETMSYWYHSMYLNDCRAGDQGSRRKLLLDQTIKRWETYL